MSEQIEIYERFSVVNAVDPSFYADAAVKRGLRNADGTGVVAGVTNISDVHGYRVENGVKVPDEGKLYLRGFDLEEIIAGFEAEQRYGFEEIVYLLLCGNLPTEEQLANFIAAIDSQRDLPSGFTASMIMRNTSPDVMNVLSRSILMFYAKDVNAEIRDAKHEIETAISLISRLPRVMVNSYHALDSKFNGGSMYIHPFIPGQRTAETILSMLRPDRHYTEEEARLLDIMLCLHAEHGGGNNSTFVCRAISSSDTDPYSAYAGAIGSLKGHRHGGANHKVVAMQQDAKERICNWEDDSQVEDYLAKVLRKEAFDGSGLIYGMGHAVYTLSDPRAKICKRYASKLAEGTEYEAEYHLLESIERLTPAVFAEVKGSDKAMCANIDMYSGFVYTMLGIPEVLFTPIFASSRMAGWAAHRFEEIVSSKRIMRPAYRTTGFHREYMPLASR